MPFDQPGTAIDNLKAAVAQIGRPRSLIAAERALRDLRDRRQALAQQRHDLSCEYRRDPQQATQRSLEKVVAAIRAVDIEIAAAVNTHATERAEFAPQVGLVVEPFRRDCARRLLEAIATYQRVRAEALQIRAVSKDADLGLSFEPVLADLTGAAATLRRQLGEVE